MTISRETIQRGEAEEALALLREIRDRVKAVERALAGPHGTDLEAHSVVLTVDPEAEGLPLAPRRRRQ